MRSIFSVSTPLSLHLPPESRVFLKFSHPFPILTVKPTNRRRRRISSQSASITQNNLELSWVSPDRRDAEEFNGWAMVEEAISPKNQKTGLPTKVLLGIGTSMVALLAVFAHFLLSRKGLVLRFSSPFHVYIESKSLGADYTSNVDERVNELLMESVLEEVDETAEVNNHIKREEGNPGRVVVPVSADATQQEALLMLKNLKIIEDEVKADELCTRREYARWLLLLNSRLERNQKKRLITSVALAGSTINAFDDVSGEDPDFEYIQALAEAGIVLSKLVGKNLPSELDNSKNLGCVNFFPERFILRQDLISWKAKLEYDAMPEINEEILRNKIGFMDAREIESHVLPVLFMDMLANNKSITRKVFGQGKRFQPGKPCTKAQAAVALTSGRTMKAILNEFSKLAAENSARQVAMEEIRSELLERGDIQRHWEQTLEEERQRGLKAETAFRAAIKHLENGKIDEENALAAYVKEKAALECQKQLLSSIKEEVDEMTVRLECEKANYFDERHKTRTMVSDLEIKYGRALDAKSILEAELEALRILRSWIEDEARKGQARSKVLQEAGQRWKWGNRS